MSKQDRVFTRTPSDLERKYNLGKLSANESTLAKLSDQMQQLSQTLSQFMASTNVKVADLQNKLEFYHGVGTFFVSIYEDNPADWFGGEWELYSDGYIVMGQDETLEGLHSLLQLPDRCYVWKRIA